jgi:hypothetical protein
VTWRRSHWQATTYNKAKRFTRLHDALRFRDRLVDDGALCGPIESRVVGPWGKR